MRSATHLFARACLHVAAVAIVALGTVTTTPTTHGLGVASAEAREGGFQVGDQLQAIEDVELDEATIATGSKVSVRAQKKVGGRVLLDLALADGHIVRAVPLTVLRGSFRRISG